MGELCAYQLEAISKVVKNADNGLDNKLELNNELRRMFYALSIRVKYGMSTDLARIANKHIRGLNRARLLKIEEASKNKTDRYSNVTEFIMKNDRELKNLGVDEKQKQELRQVLRKVLKYQDDQLMDQVKRTALVNADFWDKYGTFKSGGKNALSALADLFNHQLGIYFRHYSDESYGEVESVKLKIYLCKKQEYDSSRDILNECCIKKQSEVKTLYLYKKGELDDRDKAPECMLISKFCTLLLKCIAYSNSNNLEAAGKHFLELLKEKIGGKNVSDPDELENALESPTLYPKSGENTNSLIINNINNNNYNYYNNYIQSNVENKNIKIEIQNNIQVIYDKLDELRRRPDFQNNSDDEFFEDAVKEIDGAGLIPENIDIDDKCREIMSGEEAPDYDTLLENMADIDELKKYMQKAICIKSIIIGMQEFEDYSPAAVLYGKALETCLYKRLRVIICEKLPDYNWGKGKISEKEPQWTIGLFATILKKQFCDDTKSNKLCSKMDNEQKKYWERLYADIDKSKDIRNKASHRGADISREDIDELHKCSKRIICLSSELNDYKEKL